MGSISVWADYPTVRQMSDNLIANAWPRLTKYYFSITVPSMLNNLIADIASSINNERMNMLAGLLKCISYLYVDF